MSEEDKVPSPDGAGVVPEPETVRRRPKWLAPAAVGCVLVLLAVGGVAGCRMWSARELAEAKEACAVAADGARGAANDYNTVVNGQAADASAVTVDQVKDARTVDALAKALKTTAPEYEGCLAGSKAGLDEATSKLDRQAAWYRTRTGSLSKAVKAVESSRLDRTVEDAEKLLADSKGRVADEKTRSMLEQAIKDRDADAIGEAVNAVDGSVKAKAKADADEGQKGGRGEGPGRTGGPGGRPGGRGPNAGAAAGPVLWRRLLVRRRHRLHRRRLHGRRLHGRRHVHAARDRRRQRWGFRPQRTNQRRTRMYY